jgi:hypothetical protein
MPQYQVTIHFEVSDELMSLVPAHREYIDGLINTNIIEHYAVTMETQRAWITFKAQNKKEVVRHLRKSPLCKYWTYEIDELFVLDGQHYRLPELNFN